MMNDTRVVDALLCSGELYCSLDQPGVAVAGATNAMNTRQGESVTYEHLSFSLDMNSRLISSAHPPPRYYRGFNKSRLPAVYRGL